jgi:hypothetical protein
MNVEWSMGNQAPLCAYTVFGIARVTVAIITAAASLDATATAINSHAGALFRKEK